MKAVRIIRGHEKDLGGGFKVARLLPAAAQRSIGPFIFMDHFGPTLRSGDPAHDVRPHPHIGLSTVSYLFEGALLHHDSTGARQEIRPGDVNWMSAGRGIVHSERTPERLRGRPHAMHGLQLWCALPQNEEECEPSFQHVPSAELPTLERPGARVRVLVGSLGARRSPVRASAGTLYLHLSLAPGARLHLAEWMADWPEELALYAPEQDLLLNGELLPARQLAVLRSTSGGAPGGEPGTGTGTGRLVQSPASPEFELSPLPDTQVPTELVLLGGNRLDGHRYLWWNFVSSRKERIDQAARDWAEGRFPQVPGEQDFIPLPDKRP